MMGQFFLGSPWVRKLVGTILLVLVVFALGYTLSRTIVTVLPSKSAIVVCSLLLKISPDDTPTRYALGTALLGVSRIEEAIAELTKVVEKAPNVVRYRNALGLAFLQQGDADKAAHEFREALRIDPHSRYLKQNLDKALSLRSKKHFPNTR